MKLKIKKGVGNEKIYTDISYSINWEFVDEQLISLKINKVQYTIPLISKYTTTTPSYSDTFFWLPENLDLKALLITNGRKERFLYNYAFIISSVYLSRFQNKKYTKNDFVPINVDTAREIISQRKTVEIIKDLVNWGILECDYKKKIGSKSYGYRFPTTSPSYSDTFRKTQVKDKLIIKKMNNWKEKQRKEAEAAGEDYLHLFNFIWQIDIQYEKAIRFINKNYIPFTDDYESRKLMVELIKERDIFFKIDKKGERAHTNLTNLASDLRQFITYKGNTLAQVDLKNSQPFLFNLLIREKIDWANTNQVDEYNRFKKLTQDGIFYEFLMNEFGVSDDKRKEFKLLFFGRVFFDINRKELKKEEKMFQTLFPTIFQFIREFKEKDYTNLAIQLQRAESKAIIHGCIRRIRKERPDMFVSTIHDSIVCEPENLVYIGSIIEDVFELGYNLKPGIKMEEF